LESVVAGVFQPLRSEVESLPDVRCADARSAEIDRPDGVRLALQVSVYKVEPVESVFARNLLSKYDARSTLADEVVPVRP
jgi:hypothetical protein